MADAVPQSHREVLDRLDTKGLVDLAVALGQINSPPGEERQVADFVLEWMRSQKLQTLRQEAAPDRPNAIAFLRGAGGRPTLLLNGHLDTEWGAEEDRWILEEPRATGYTAYVEGDRVIGRGVANDKGLVAAFLLAAKAVKDSGIRLGGDIILTAVCGEIGRAPVDEFQGPRYLGKGLGTRHLVQHGIVGDYALVAEPSRFGIACTNTGALYVKVTVRGRGGTYTPWIRRDPQGEQRSAIVRATVVVDAIERWAQEYEHAHRYESPSGPVVPTVNIGAIRGGLPYYPSHTVGVCSVYVDIRVAPPDHPADIVRELAAVLERTGMPVEIQPYLFRRGYDAKGAEPLVRATEAAHRAVFGEASPVLRAESNSAWNDTNVFNEVGIPSVKYGPLSIFETDHTRMFTSAPGIYVKDLVDAAKVYALVMLGMCAAP